MCNPPPHRRPLLKLLRLPYEEWRGSEDRPRGREEEQEKEEEEEE